MSQSPLGDGFAASVAAILPRRSRLVLVSGQALLCAAAFAWSVQAGLAAVVLSVISLFRYVSLASFAAALGSQKTLLMLFSGGLWLAGFLALAAALVATARLAHAALVWAAAAACLGPLLVSALALVAGGRALLGGRRLAGGLR
ncbi:MAG TPA: hypothetical protein VMC79_00635 [Rectinemataceae bacterium]|nr:hypothetical protein [Rectinemataceae bacterium]